MKTQASKKWTAWTLAATLFVLFVASGCSKPDQPAPEIPPEGSMVLDFSDFEDGNRVADSTDNWTHAAVNVLVWDVVVAVNLIVPVTAFREAFNHEAKWKRKLERWVWAYDFNWGAKYSAELHGWLDNGLVNWEMHISKNGGFQDVIWFTGQSQTDRSSGSWTLNRDGNNPTPYIGIEWERNDIGEANVRYTNITPNSPNNGDYLEGGVLDDPVYDRYHYIYRAQQDNLIEIFWHHLNQNGKVKNEAHFGDTDWHCWDAFHIDATTCI